MARIRTVKPCFFRHLELIELEIRNGECKPMLVFEALWSQCDKNGVFEWKPRYLQLDIIPFYWEATGKQLVDTLELLCDNGFIEGLTDGHKVYGYVPSFKDHQRIGGKEAKDPPTYPDPAEMTSYPVDRRNMGSNGEALGKQQGSQEGKGREGNGGGERREKPATTKTEKVLLETFDEKEEEIKRIFPGHDFEVEKVTCIAHYRSHPPPLDPYVVIVKWFRRATPKPLPEKGHPHQTEADLRAKGLIE